MIITVHLNIRKRPRRIQKTKCMVRRSASLWCLAEAECGGEWLHR